MEVIKAYDVEHYKAFNFKEHLEQSYLKANANNFLLLSKNGYFAASKKHFEQFKKKDDIPLLNVERFDRQDIVIGKSNLQHRVEDEHQVFTKQLIQEEVYWMRYFLKLITKHLDNRESEGRKLTIHDNVRILIGETVQFIEEIEALRVLEDFTAAMRSHIAHVVRQACNNLAKLVGGRSFVSFGVIEMLYTFEALNKIYLT